MKKLLFASLFFFIAGTASADYILIKIDVNKFALRPGAGGGGAIGGIPGQGPGPGPGQGPGPGGFPGKGGPGGFPGKGGPGGGFPGGGGGFPGGGEMGGPGGGIGGGGPVELNIPPGGIHPPQPNMPVPPDDPEARWISAVVEIKNRAKMPFQTPFGFIFTYEHRWSTRSSWLPVNSSIAPWVDWPFVQSEPFSPDFAAKLNREKISAKKDKNIESLLYLARAALARGYLSDFHKAMKEIEAIDDKHQVVKNYQRVKKGLQAPFKDEDPAQKEFLQELTQRGYKDVPSSKRHFAMYYDANIRNPFIDGVIARRLALMEETLETFYYWFAIQKDSTIQPNLPKYRLTSVLGSKEEFKNRHSEWGSPPMVGDGFTPRRDNVVVQSADVRLKDGLFQEFKGLVTSKIQDANQRIEQQGLKVILTREEMLSGKTLDNKQTGAAAISIAAAQTAVLLEKVLEDGAERHMVTHETVRQILIASEVFPRNVQIPEWMIEGLASFFETPDGSVYSTVGGPSWTHLISFKHHVRVTKKLERENAKNVLFRVVTDGYFNDARNLTREAQEQPTISSMQNASNEAWELARSTAWAFTYYLAQKGKLDSIFLYGKELDKLPRDLDLNEQVLQASFGKSFNMADTRNAQLIDDTKLQNLATNWFDTMLGVNLEPGVLQAYYERERARKDPPSDGNVVVNNPKNGGGGANPKLPPNNPQPPQQGWQEVNSAEGGFSVQFPGAPESKNDEVDTPAGKMKLNAFVLDNPDKKGGYAVMYTDLPAGPNYTDDAIAVKLFDGVVASFNKGGKVNSMIKTSLGAAVGRELLAEDKNGSKLKMRIYISGNRMYMVFVGWDKDGTMPADQGKFFSSFSITGVGAGGGGRNPGGEGQPGPMPVPPQQPPEQPQPNQNTLTGNWSGTESLAGYGKVSFNFQPGGNVTMIDRDGTTPGNYNQNGNNISLAFGPVTYTGTVNGNTMSGTASNGQTTWTWSAARGAGGFNPMPPPKGPGPGPRPKGKTKF